MMDHLAMQRIVDQIEWPDGRFLIRRARTPVGIGEPVFGPLYLQVESEVAHSDTGKPYPARGRKWLLSRHMTTGEVVQTAFKAVLAFVEHEARESFRYRGAPIFGPHFDIDAMVEFAADDAHWAYRRPT